MTTVNRAWSKSWAVFKSQAFRSVMDCIAIVALILGIYAIYSESSHAKEQANHLRITVCGIIEPYAAAPGDPPTDGGRRLKEAFERARSPQGADCTTDPNDGK